MPKLERNLLQGLVATIFIGSLANSWLNDFTSMYCLVTMAGVLMAARSDVIAAAYSTPSSAYSSFDIFSLAASIPSKLTLENSCSEIKSS